MTKAYHFRAMGSSIYFTGLTPEQEKETEQLFQMFEQKASRFLPNSEIARLYRASLGVPVQVDKMIADLLDKSLTIARKTGYRLHPFLGEEMRAIGYGKSFMKEAELKAVPGSTAYTGRLFREEPLELITKEWIVKKRPFQFDFGGFGKGYIVDQAVEKLKQNSDQTVVVNAGGDLRTMGSAEVGIRHPLLANRDMIRMEITEAALATSGKHYRRWKVEGQEQHHILDGLTGLPAENDVLQASVIAATAMEAEAASKLFCILPFEKAKQLTGALFPKLAYFVYFENHQLVFGGNAGLYRNMEVAS